MTKMKKPTKLRAAAILVAAGAIAGSALGCGYSPNPESGTLKCGPGDSCPEGYKCGLSNACWRPEDKPEPLLGCWLFDPNSIQRIDWSDGVSDSVDLSTIGDFLEVAAGTESPLLGFYWCQLNLFLHGQSTVLEPDQACNFTDDAGFQFSNFPNRLSFSTADGAKGRLEFSMNFDFVSATSNGSGAMRTTGTLTKGPCPPAIAPSPSQN